MKNRIKIFLILLWESIKVKFVKKKHPFYTLCETLPYRFIRKLKLDNKAPAILFETNGYLLTISYYTTFIDLKMCNFAPFVTVHNTIEIKRIKSNNDIVGVTNSMTYTLRDKEAREKKRLNIK